MVKWVQGSSKHVSLIDMFDIDKDANERVILQIYHTTKKQKRKRLRNQTKTDA